MYRTNKFASEEEVEEIKTLHKKAITTPVMAFSTSHAMQGGFSGYAWKGLQVRIHEIALSKGLPEIPGYYGIDLESGEFVSQFNTHEKKEKNDE